MTKTKKAAKGKAARTVKVLTREEPLGKVLLKTFSELRLQGGLVSLSDLAPGQRLHRLYKGERFDYVVGKDSETISMVKPRKAGPWNSLSLAAAEASGHQERGSIVLRDETGQVLMKPPEYGERAGAPKAKSTKAGKPAKARKPKNGSGRIGTGTVKVTKGVRCGQRGCGAMIPANEVGAHMATHAPKAEHQAAATPAPRKSPKTSKAAAPKTSKTITCGQCGETVAVADLAGHTHEGDGS